MNTLPLPAIIERLCELSGCSSAMAQSFLSEFSALVSQALTDRGSIVVRGLGTFRAIEMGGVKSVEFAPDQSLASAVNAPFAMFEPVELDDAVTGDMLAAAAIETVVPENEEIADNEVATDAEEIPQPEPASDNHGDEEEPITSEPTADDVPAEKTTDADFTPEQTNSEPEIEPAPEPVQPVMDKPEPEPQKTERQLKMQLRPHPKSNRLPCLPLMKKSLRKSVWWRLLTALTICCTIFSPDWWHLLPE